MIVWACGVFLTLWGGIVAVWACGVFLTLWEWWYSVGVLWQCGGIVAVWGVAINTTTGNYSTIEMKSITFMCGF